MLIIITSGIPSKYYHGLSLHNIGDQIGTGESIIAMLLAVSYSGSDDGLLVAMLYYCLLTIVMLAKSDDCYREASFTFHAFAFVGRVGNFDQK